METSSFVNIMSIRIYQLKDHSISVDQARYATSVVVKYLDTATVKVIKTFYKTTFPDTGRSTGAYIIFYQGRPIDHGTHVPGPVAQSSTESAYNAACTAGMALVHFRMLIHEVAVD